MRQGRGVILLSQREYTQKELEYLISCPKEIIKPPRKSMVLTNGHQRNDMDLCSVFLMGMWIYLWFFHSF
jgi:hypothetical protein